MRLFLFVLFAISLSGCVVEGPSTTVSASQKPSSPMDMYYEAIQCENPWTPDSGPAPAGSPQEEEQIRSYYADHGVTMGEIRFERVYEVTCESCACPRGDWVVTTINAEDTETARSLGWDDYRGPPTANQG